MRYEERSRYDRNRVVNEIGNWLDKYDWKYFLNLTFAKDYVNSSTAQHCFHTFIQDLGDEVIYFMTVEGKKNEHPVHIHALIGEVKRVITWAYGIAKILLYDRNLGARFYVPKCITNPYVEWEFKLNESKEGGCKVMKAKRLTPLRAIRKNCISCSGGSFLEVRRCVVPDCHLFSYRFGKNPFRKGIGGRKGCINGKSPNLSREIVSKTGQI